jgi:hypothetical protein
LFWISACDVLVTLWTWICNIKCLFCWLCLLVWKNYPFVLIISWYKTDLSRLELRIWFWVGSGTSLFLWSLELKVRLLRAELYCKIGFCVPNFSLSSGFECRTFLRTNARKLLGLARQCPTLLILACQAHIVHHKSIFLIFIQIQYIYT